MITLEAEIKTELDLAKSGSVGKRWERVRNVGARFETQQGNRRLRKGGSPPKDKGECPLTSTNLILKNKPIK